MLAAQQGINNGIINLVSTREIISIWGELLCVVPIDVYCGVFGLLC